MTKAKIAGGAFAALFVLLALAVTHRVLERELEPVRASSPAMPPSGADAPATAESGVHPSLLHGRITTRGGSTLEGRLRWGGSEEAFWGDYFNGRKSENPWRAHVPLEQMPRERISIRILGVEMGHRVRQLDLDRPFMSRFGDIARIESRGEDVQVTLKSGTAFDLDRFSATDFDDGLRVWDASRGVVDLDSWQVLAIELLPAPAPAPAPGAAPHRLHGTVRTRQGDFTGFVQWDRQKCLGSDELGGNTSDGPLRLRFDSIRSIARRSGDSSLVTLLDGREITLSGTRDVGDGSRGCYVDDLRYGRVLVSWEAFERIDFSSGDGGPGDGGPGEGGPGDGGPAYGDFPPGRPLRGSVTTSAGRRLAGRLVYDLDESETTETFDAPAQGVDYTIPFGLIASIVPAGGEQGGDRRARVSLHDGEELLLEHAGDLGKGHAGLLIFVAGRERPEYVSWTDVERIDFDRPPEMYPAFGAP